MKFWGKSSGAPHPQGGLARLGRAQLRLFGTCSEARRRPRGRADSDASAAADRGQAGHAGRGTPEPRRHAGEPRGLAGERPLFMEGRLGSATLASRPGRVLDTRVRGEGRRPQTVPRFDTALAFSRFPRDRWLPGICPLGAPERSPLPGACHANLAQGRSWEAKLRVSDRCFNVFLHRFLFGENLGFRPHRSPWDGFGMAGAGKGGPPRWTDSGQPSVYGGSEKVQRFRWWIFGKTVAGARTLRYQSRNARMATRRTARDQERGRSRMPPASFDATAFVQRGCIGGA